MTEANPLWGAPRIHGELGKLGIAVSERTVSRLLRRRRRPSSQTWRTFLTNHVASLVSMDFFTVPTLTGRVLFVLVLLTHHRRRIVHLAVTEHPTAAWTAQQIIEAFPNDTAPRWLLRDRDAIYGDVFRRRVAGMGITEVITSPSSPWQNPYAERLIGSVRRECLDHVIVLGERHLRRLLTAYLSYYHGARTHLCLGEGRADDTTRSDADGRTRGRVPGSWRITSSLRTTCSLTGTVDRRLDFDVRLRVCAERPSVGDPRRFKEHRVRHGIRSGRIAASRDGFGEGPCRRRRPRSTAARSNISSVMQRGTV